MGGGGGEVMDLGRFEGNEWFFEMSEEVLSLIVARDRSKQTSRQCSRFLAGKYDYFSQFSFENNKFRKAYILELNMCMHAQA